MISTLELLVFANQSLYCYANFPQIVANYRNKSASALSDFYLILLFNTYSMLLFYFFCLTQPVSYRLSIAVQFLTTATLVGQRLYYHRDEWWRWVMACYNVNTGFFLGFIPWACYYPVSTGNAAGWIALGLILVNRIPQIFHFYRTKTVEGFSPLFLVAFGAAGLMEMVIVLVYHLPIQTFFMALSGFAAIMIMSYQYRLYRRLLLPLKLTDIYPDHPE